jgi:energy-coupling factor transport system ATP-binding protein
VLEGVDARGAVGEVVALVGPNGGGKSTLLRTLSGLIPALAGEVWRRPGRVAHLPQNPAAVLHLPTVRAEVELTLRRVGDGDDVDELLALLGLEGLGGRHPRDLSSGERQRAAIAALLCGRPALAVLDEPTRGMDAAARASLHRLVARLAARGAAVVLATHDVDLAASLADRVLEVRDGAVRDLGPPRRALTAPSPYATQLGELWEGGPTTVEEAVMLL